MVTKMTQKNAMQEATQIVKRYESARSGVQRWTCEVCGMVHSNSIPTSCDSCGVTSAFMQQEEKHSENSEIGTRW